MDDTLNKILELVGKKRGAIKELANFLGISGNNISDWKSGKNKSYRQYLPQIASYYGVSLDWLTGLSDQKEKPAPDSEDGLSDDVKFLLSMYHSVPPERKAEALAKIANDLKKAGLIE